MTIAQIESSVALRPTTDSSCSTPSLVASQGVVPEPSTLTLAVLGLMGGAVEAVGRSQLQRANSGFRGLGKLGLVRPPVSDSIAEES
jgi:hypothetical protein